MHRVQGERACKDRSDRESLTKATAKIDFSQSVLVCFSFVPDGSRGPDDAVEKRLEECLASGPFRNLSWTVLKHVLCVLGCWNH